MKTEEQLRLRLVELQREQEGNKQRLEEIGNTSGSLGFLNEDTPENRAITERKLYFTQGQIDVLGWVLSN